MVSVRMRVFWVCLTVFSPTALSADQIGDRVADFRLQDTDGREHSLEQHRSAGNIVLLEFWSFKCPVSLAQDNRLAALREKFQNRGVAVLAVASNADEPLEAVRRNAEILKLPFPILMDREGILAESLGVGFSPGICIIDREGILRYRGSLDNHKDVSNKSRIAFAEEALEAILAGKSVVQPQSKILGCSIKRGQSPKSPN